MIADGPRQISGRSFLGAVAQLAKRLPPHAYAINLCTSRSRFLLGFAAAMARGQTTLLPPDRTDASLGRVAQNYPDSYLLIDEEAARPAAGSTIMVPSVEPGGDGPNTEIPADRLAAIVFTSGSTGDAQPIAKTWGLFCRSVDLISTHLQLSDARPHHIVATVPAQHMYGLETTSLLPLRTAHITTHCRTFFPADLQAALQSAPPPRMLVTTPMHLRSCIENGGPMPTVDLIVSATAPLSQSLAQRAERLFGGTLVEIFGFSEAGSVAVRHTASTDRWELFEGLQIDPSADGHSLTAPYLPGPVAVQDRIELLAGGRQFLLLGRRSDQINVAGKRTSLAALNAAITVIEGVRDGVFLEPDGLEPLSRTGRLIALAVAPGLDRRRLLAELRKRIDPAFLPRPLYLVDALPRREHGKLARGDLIALAKICWLREQPRQPAHEPADQQIRAAQFKESGPLNPTSSCGDTEFPSSNPAKNVKFGGGSGKPEH